jgi:hypothetical protein
MSRNYAHEEIVTLSRSQLMDLVRTVRGAEKGKCDAADQAAATPPQPEREADEPSPEQSPPPAESKRFEMPKKEVPTPTSPEWSSYVLGLFDDEELEGENPKVDGLRRVAEKLIGTIVEEGCELVSPPILENQNRACVKAWVVFRTGSTKKRVEALADVCEDNCDAKFARFPTSVAESRAKGRCFRAALKLRKVLAAEEVGTDVPLANEPGEGKINPGQKTAIQIMADRLNVSIPKIIAHLEIGKPDLDSLTHTEALLVVKNLNTIQQTGQAPPSLMRA